MGCGDKRLVRNVSILSLNPSDCVLSSTNDINLRLCEGVHSSLQLPLISQLTLSSHATVKSCHCPTDIINQPIVCFSSLSLDKTLNTLEKLETNWQFSNPRMVHDDHCTKTNCSTISGHPS